ncbi:hypothetical protein D3C87_2059010 [compost metagenome]
MPVHVGGAQQGQLDRLGSGLNGEALPQEEQSRAERCRQLALMSVQEKDLS